MKQCYTCRTLSIYCYGKEDEKCLKQTIKKNDPGNDFSKFWDLPSQNIKAYLLFDKNELISMITMYEQGNSPCKKIPYKVLDAINNNSAIFIERIATAKRYQRRGYGRKLFEYLYEQAHQDSIFCTHPVGDGLQFWPKLGFRDVCDSGYYVFPTVE